MLQQYVIYVDSRRVYTRTGVLGRSAAQAVKTFKLYVYKRSFAGKCVTAVPVKTPVQVYVQVQRLAARQQARRRRVQAAGNADALVQVLQQQLKRVCKVQAHLDRYNAHADLCVQAA